MKIKANDVTIKYAFPFTSQHAKPSFSQIFSKIPSTERVNETL